MLTVSDSFKQAMHQSTKSLRSKVVVDNTINISDNDGLISFAIESDGYLFGSAVSIASVKLLGTNYDLVSHDIELKTSTKTDQANDTWEELSLGQFQIVEQQVDLEKGTTTLKCFDALIRLSKIPYIAGDLVFPNTIANIATQLSTRHGLTIDESVANLPNASQIITEDPYAKISNLTYRDILNEIAGATGTMAIIKNGKLYFQSAQKTSVGDWTYDHLKKIKFKPKYGPVNSVVLARTPQEDNIAVRDEASITANGLTEVKLANNEILDDDRQTMATPILQSINGFEFYPFEAETEGHGYYEVGDRVSVSEGDKSWQIIITHIKLELGNGIKELLTGLAPVEEQTNYARAGGISKTVFNTELKVDKQQQEITAIVSRQDQTDQHTSEQFTQIHQNLTNITQTVQTVGGGNLIKNSVGYGKNDGTLVHWSYNQEDDITTETSPASIMAGALSGNQINLSNGALLTQRVAVSVGQPHTVSFRVLKGLVGSGSVVLQNNIDTFTIPINAEQSYSWTEEVLTFTPTMGWVDVKIITSADTTIAITDLMLASGDSRQPWRQSAGEIYNTQVSLDANGIQVRSSVYDGDYVEITPLEFAGYSTAGGTKKKVFSLNRDTTEVEKLETRTKLKMNPIEVIPLKNSRKGWAFVPTGEN